MQFSKNAKLQKQFRIFLLPPDYKIVAKSLHSETELGINKASSDNVYRLGGDVEINKMNELMKVSINCSDFSIFFD